jgi:hypothetical protein
MSFDDHWPHHLDVIDLHLFQSKRYADPVLRSEGVDISERSRVRC